MKSDIYGAQAIWMHIYYLIMFSRPGSEINGTLFQRRQNWAQRGFALAQAYPAGKWQNQRLNPVLSNPKSQILLYYTNLPKYN